MNPRLVALVSAVAAVSLVAVVWGVTSDRGRTASRAGRGASATTAAPTSGASGAASGGRGSPTERAPRLPAGVAGPGCADYATAVPAGPGALEAMAGETLVAAIDGSPLLTTFSSAMAGRLNGRVDLTRELGRGRVTAFVPVDSAFAAVAAERMAGLRRDATALRTLLRAHVVAGALDVAHAAGRHRTLAGTTLAVAGSPTSLTVDGVPVICGGLTTSTGVIYLLGSVLPVG
jgi:uncharacterized surface protein with fasciclin (FAS1) repeats